MNLPRLLVAVTLGATALAAQTPEAPAFEVVSVKPNASGALEAGQPLPCNMSFFRPLHIGARGAEMSTLVTHLNLRSGADRVVVDRTGLAGKFDWDLQWTGDPLATDAAGSGVSLFTAVREQLGLRLDGQRAVVDVLVVERAEKPAPD